MNIIFVQEWFEKSATFKHLLYFANLLVKNGHNVLLVNHRESGKPDNDCNEILFKYVNCQMSFNKLHKDFEQQIKAFKPDIVHSFCNRYEAYIALLIKKATNAKLVVHYEDSFEEVFFNHIPFNKALILFLNATFFVDNWLGYNYYLEKRLLKHFDAFDTLTKPLEEMLRNKGIKKPIRQIYPPIDLNFFHPNVDGNHLRRKLDLENKFVITHTGTIYGHWMEGFEKYLKAISLIKNDIPALRLVFTGRPTGNKESLKLLIEKYSLKDITTNVGYIENFSEIPCYVAMSDILIEPQGHFGYDEYRLPSKLHNYMAAGKPIITFSNGFIKELSDDEVVKVNFLEETSENIAEKIQYLYNNLEYRQKIGKNARMKAEKLFNMEQNTQELINFYQEILQ